MLFKEFAESNYAFAKFMLESVDWYTPAAKQGKRVASVHCAFVFQYDTRGKSRPDMKSKNPEDRYVLAVAFDKNKGKWDFPGGKNDSDAPDPVIQFLTTLYNELYEELGVTIIAPLETFVIQLLRCGRDGTSLLLVCGVKDLYASKFRAEMQRKQQIRPRLPSCHLEMTDFKYLAQNEGEGSDCTSYVRGHYMRVIEIAKQETHRFPSFDRVMRIGPR